MSEFSLKPPEVLFDYTLSQINLLVDARIKRNKDVNEKVERKRVEKEGVKGNPGTMTDLKLMMGGGIKGWS